MCGLPLKIDEPNFWRFGFCFVFYLDNILVSSGTKEEHSKHLREVFNRLHKAGLAINLPKSEFFATELEFLGHVVNASSIKVSPKHAAAIQDYPTPCSKEEISRFLSLLNFFWSFLPEAILLLKTLMMKKKALFLRGKGQQNSFNQAKEALLNSAAFVPVCSGLA